MIRISLIISLSILSLQLVNAQGLNNKAPVLDSFTAAASSRYKDPSFFRRLFIGENYRDEWSAEIRMPVFRLPNTGMKIIELGGGQQTKSLKLEDSNGKEWALRTVDKDAAGAVPKKLKGTIAQKIVQDIISGSYPYAALVVGQLAKSAGIVAPDPKLYYIPNDAGFGKYQDIFTGHICFLEEREPTRKGTKETESTEDVQEEIIEANDRLIIQREVLKARLLDMLVADWDRHADQWRWGIVDSTKAKYFYAIPRDRDQAFFMATGLIPRVGKFFDMHHINWFKEKSKGFKKLNYKSRQFDQVFLNDLDAAEWERITKEFISKLSDKAISDAVKKLPPEIYAISGEAIEQKLISRNRTLLQEVMKYYKFLSTRVQVNGSNENEIFQVSGSNGIITVTVFRAGSRGKKDIRIYERKFYPGETVLISLNGYDGNDKFIIDQSADSKIKLHLIGGDGIDNYQIKGNIKHKIYDSKSENSLISRDLSTNVQPD